MDASPFLALVLIAALSLLLLFAIRKPSHNRGDARRRLPPTPPGLPVVGHLPFLGSLPHRKLRSMAASYGPVMLVRFGRVPTVVASSAAAAQEVMKTRDLAYASRPRMRMVERLAYGRDLAFAPYGEHWRQARRVCVLHLLSQRRVSSFRHDREQEAAALVDRVRRAGARDGAVNLTALLISYTNGIICRAAFGDDGSSWNYGGEKLSKLFADFEELIGAVTVGEFVPWLAWIDTLMGLDAKVTRTYQEMGALLDRVIDDHRQRRRAGGCRKDDDHRDFVDVLLDVNEAAEAEDDTDAGRGVMFDNGSIKAIIRVRTFSTLN